MHIKASSNAINFRQFLLELCPLLTSNSHKYAVFRTFCLHALRYWAEILHITLLYCNTDQVRMSSICVDFCGSYAPWNLEYWKYIVFRTFLLHALTYWAEILHMTLFYCTTYQVWVLSICFNFVGVMPLLGLRILKKHSFALFSLTRFDILSWNFTYDFVLLYYRSSWSVVNSHQFL